MQMLEIVTKSTFEEIAMHTFVSQLSRSNE